jgi:hypothetical protein
MEFNFDNLEGCLDKEKLVRDLLINLEPSHMPNEACDAAVISELTSNSVIQKMLLKIMCGAYDKKHWPCIPYAKRSEIMTKIEKMVEMMCPWLGTKCQGERCIAYRMNEKIPEDIDGEPVVQCLRAEEILIKLRE